MEKTKKMNLTSVILFVTTLLLGLISGLFYAYSCSVMPGLSKLDDISFLSSMQSINRAIQNPLFFISFLGIIILLPINTYLQYSKPVTTVFKYLLAATIIYFGGVIMVTIFGNIPLNTSLDHFDIVHASTIELSTQRKIFEASWIDFNNIRTIASSLAFGCVIMAWRKMVK
jgi:uncharacterized membrane protein